MNQEMTRQGRRLWVIWGLIGCFLFLWVNLDLAAAKDPDYPVKPIDVYIGVGAGGPTDTCTRTLLHAAGKILGQSFVPIQKLGAGGAIMATTVMNAKPDGYTLGAMTTSPVQVIPYTEGSPYKDLSGFTFIMNYGAYVYPLISRSDSPWKNWKEFIEWARKNPKGAKIGLTAAKTADYKGLVLWQIEQREGVEFTCLAFKGGLSEAFSALLGGHINVFGISDMLTPRQYLDEGKLRLLAYMGPHKAKGYENYPTTQEMYGFSIPDFIGIWGPKGLPEYVLRKLDDAFAKAVKDPDFVKVMDRYSMPIHYMDRPTVAKNVEIGFRNTGELYKKIRAEEKKRKR